jgi:hypothetical protein
MKPRVNENARWQKQRRHTGASAVTRMINIDWHGAHRN